MQLPNLENKEKQIKSTKLTKEKPAIKRGNKPQAPLICGLPLWRDMDQVYVSSLMVISQEVEPDIYVFGSGV